MTEKARHIAEYTVLAIAPTVLLAAFYYLRFEKNALMVLFGISSGFYAIWGIIHHALESRLTKSIFFEYILFGFLIFLLLFFALNI